MTELGPSFPKNYFSSLNTQNCDQGIILKEIEGKTTPFSRVRSGEESSAFQAKPLNTGFVASEMPRPVFKGLA